MTVNESSGVMQEIVALEKRHPAISEGVLSTIGNTPLVRLNHMFKDLPCRVFAKLEGFNPGGSAKDRPALQMLVDAMGAGLVKPGTVIIESSSGNLGIGLAQSCRYLGLRFICVVDPKTTQQNIRILKAYGAEMDVVTEPDHDTGEFLHARIKRVQLLLRLHNHAYWPNQYGNLSNAGAHYRTMHEIVTALEGRIDFLFIASSTCGTLRGCAEYVRNHNLDTKIFAVDAEGSVIFGGKAAPRLIPGHGAARRPELYSADLAHECIWVSDYECVTGCRMLVHCEAILAGGSSGGVVMGFERAKEKIKRGATCVLILHDRGERYLDTIYSDEWVIEHFGELPRLRECQGELQG